MPNAKENRSEKSIRKFMAIAIEEMNKSKGEHASRPDPKVGAVIIDKEGYEMDRAHRGEIRVGEHTEYILLDKKLQSSDLEGSTLFVTLEPCCKRGDGKIPCAKRIVKARINRVYIGMPDPDTNIEGRGWSYLMNNGIDVRRFDKDLAGEIYSANKDFIEYQRRRSEELKEPWQDFEQPSLLEKELVNKATEKDLLSDLVDNYLVKITGENKIKPSDRSAYLEQSEVLVAKGKKRTPTKAGLMCFGKKPHIILTNSSIDVVIQGKKRITKSFSGPLVRLPEQIIDFLIENMTHFEVIDDVTRKRVPQFPPVAIREALVNAIVHRDYLPSSKILVELSSDQLSIRSPGSPIRPVTLNRIQKLDAPSISRNPRIANIFTNMGLMEERGSGIKRMYDSLKEAELEPPEFDLIDGFFIVTFLSHLKPRLTTQLKEQTLKQLSQRQGDAIDYIYEQTRISSEEYAKRYDIDVSTARRDLRKLINLGVLKKKYIAEHTVVYVVNSDSIS